MFLVLTLKGSSFEDGRKLLTSRFRISFADQENFSPLTQAHLNDS